MIEDERLASFAWVLCTCTVHACFSRKFGNPVDVY